MGGSQYPVDYVTRYAAHPGGAQCTELKPITPFSQDEHEAWSGRVRECGAFWG